MASEDNHVPGSLGRKHSMTEKIRTFRRTDGIHFAQCIIPQKQLDNLKKKIPDIEDRIFQSLEEELRKKKKK